MKAILVPTDFSDCSDYAVELALKIARSAGLELHFLHFLSVPPDWILLSDTGAKLYPDINLKVKEKQSKLNKLVQIAESNGLKAFAKLDYQDHYESILKYASQHDIDLIVMGSHGANGFKELFIGSNAQRVVRSARIPVLIVKDPYVNEKIEDIVFASDFLDENLEYFYSVVAFARLVNAKIRMVYINNPLSFIDTPTMKQRMKLYLNEAPDIVVGEDIYHYEDVEDGLKMYCAEHNCDLLAMTTHGRRGMNKLLSGSLAESVINHVHMPVLTKTLTNELYAWEKL